MNGRNKDYIEQRAIESALYTIINNSTIRETARHMGVSKSTTHKDLIERLPKFNYELHERVIEIIETNKEERHIRGGIATKKSYEKMSEHKWKQ